MSWISASGRIEPAIDKTGTNPATEGQVKEKAADRMPAAAFLISIDEELR
jgi:hypothetical protein